MSDRLEITPLRTFYVMLSKLIEDVVRCFKLKFGQATYSTVSFITRYINQLCSVAIRGIFAVFPCIIVATYFRTTFGLIAVSLKEWDHQDVSENQNCWSLSSRNFVNMLFSTTVNSPQLK
ncbi:BA75_01153T0 [Komagataella pastoris]|uniref:BA75_01153T0 n=1 Tax=Komagataella pastoris TaxID=4922 RepID=A0A1B2J7R5_PICPA|nr:BA75_01153T0 [Komagataella pastoris]